MRIVAVEEHLALPDLVRRVDRDAIAARGWPGPDRRPPEMAHLDELADTGAGRLAAMDRAGVTVQVLSASGPGADLVDPAAAPSFARDYNDRIAAVVAARPDRFAAFAHLPVTAPEAAADELERAVRDLGFRGGFVNGPTGGRFLDHPGFAPLLARAERLGVPLYLHPNIPPAAVREAYYGGLPGASGFLLSGPGFGWHAETAVHVLRLVLSGTLDRFPGLKLVVGHMGEGLPGMLARCDQVFAAEAGRRLSRGVGRTILDQVWITTSGFFSLPPFLAALTSFGADRILFAVDYPFSPSERGVEFLRRLPVSPADLARIAHGNADRLLGLAPPARDGAGPAPAWPGPDPERPS